MKCSELNIIDYLERKLNDENLKMVENHLDSCPKCKARFMALKEVYQVVGEEKREEVNPFLATRIFNQLEKETELKQSKVFRWQPAFVSAASVLLIIAGVSFGVWFGSGTANIQAQSTYADLEMQTYFYDINQEPIVSTLLEESYENNN